MTLGDGKTVRWVYSEERTVKVLSMYCFQKDNLQVQVESACHLLIIMLAIITVTETSIPMTVPETCWLTCFFAVCALCVCLCACVFARVCANYMHVHTCCVHMFVHLCAVQIACMHGICIFLT